MMAPVDNINANHAATDVTSRRRCLPEKRPRGTEGGERVVGGEKKYSRAERVPDGTVYHILDTLKQ